MFIFYIKCVYYLLMQPLISCKLSMTVSVCFNFISYFNTSYVDDMSV